MQIFLKKFEYYLFNTYLCITIIKIHLLIIKKIKQWILTSMKDLNFYLI